MDNKDIKKIVKEGYGYAARESGRCCEATSCCGSNYAADVSRGIGYSDDELKLAPDDSNLGLGCGNPTAHASLKEGETVLDLGSGAGFDCFIAANKVGSSGKVIGVDMTPDMLARARRNAENGGYTNVEFREGEIEELPVESDTIDAIISNCVINLSPDKPKVFAEAFRVLKPGGRIMVSDIVLTRPLPDYIQQSIIAYVGCLSGALLKEKYLQAIKDAGFSDIEIVSEKLFPVDFMQNDDSVMAAIEKQGKSFNQAIADIENTVLSVNVKAVKK